MLESGFKRTVKWNKYMSYMSNQDKNSNLNYLIDPTFEKVNRLFVLSFENKDDRKSYYKYYAPNVEIKNYNMLIDRNPFFELPVKNIEDTYEKIMQISDDNGYYIRGNLLDFNYFKKHYKMIAIGLSKQIELENKGTDNFSIKYDTKVIKANLCDCSEAYILVTGNIRNKLVDSIVAFKNCAPFRTCNVNVNDEYVEKAEYLDIIMPMYNLLEYSDNYQDTTGSLYQFKRDEPPVANNARVTAVTESLKYKSIRH